MWLVAIFGITMSIGPAVWQILHPLRKWLQRLALILQTAITYFLEQIALPVILKLHAWGVLEVGAFFLSFMLTAQGLRMNPDAGMYVSISGLTSISTPILTN